MYRSSPDRTYPASAGGSYRGEQPYRAWQEPTNRASPDLDPERLELKDSAVKYEQERIQVLQQERVHVQKKTFTKWCNSFLEKVCSFFGNSWFVVLKGWSTWCCGVMEIHQFNTCIHVFSFHAGMASRVLNNWCFHFLIIRLITSLHGRVFCL